MRSEAATIEQYLQELPAERREAIETVRRIILDNLPPGYEEVMNWGMITYQVPLETFPNTYNGQPLGYLALAAQKNHNALYMMNIYVDSKQEKWLRDGFKKAGKRLDMGKCCVRFKKVEDLPLDVIGKVIASTNPEQMIEMYEKGRRRAKGRKK